VTDAITLCAFTTDKTAAPLLRLAVEPNERNGPRTASRLMVDKITTVPKARVGARVGWLDGRGHSAAQSGVARVPRRGCLAQDERTA
jgi:mRNA-degrading endonuclease toxin of MazEF toxin-antitoxin module